MQISPANFDAPDLIALLRDYLAFAQQDACTHAFGIAELQRPEVQLFTARDAAGELMGCAALKTLDATSSEIKSVRTHENFQRRGVSRALMTHLETVARGAGMRALYLETHNTPPYAAACRMYEGLGFSYCGPFGAYEQNPRNVFMHKGL